MLVARYLNAVRLALLIGEINLKRSNMAFKMKGFKAHDMFEPKTGKKVVAKTYQDHLDLDKKGYTHSPNKKRMGEFKHSDAPDAKGKFKELSAPALATWMIKSRKGNLSKIISSLNQQVVFRRNTDPKYAAKMRRTMDIVRKRLGKDKK
jgi:hypothetical protein